MKRARVTLLILVSVSASCLSPCLAEESDEMRQGIADYRNHDYREAIGHFGAALNTEFNNANLHYHMANCMVHLREKEAAIREYRIAYALQPTGKIGNYSKQCLHLFGIDAEGLIAAKPKEKDKKPEESGLKKDTGLLNVSKFVSDDDRKVAQNLEDLMQQKARPGSAQLQKVGTNLFVRNYKDPNKDAQLATIEASKGEHKKAALLPNKDDSAPKKPQKQPMTPGAFLKSLFHQ